MGSSAVEGCQMLLQSLTNFINFILAGEASHSVCHRFFCNPYRVEQEGWWSATNRHGLHSSTIGSQACRKPRHEGNGDLACNSSVGLRVPLGAEAAVHAARLFLHNLEPDQA